MEVIRQWNGSNWVTLVNHDYEPDTVPAYSADEDPRFGDLRSFRQVAPTPVSQGAQLDALMRDLVAREARWKKAWEDGEMTHDEASSSALEDRWAYARLAEIRAALDAQ